MTILLGPYAAFLTVTSVLIVQALFFADGGLLAFATFALFMLPIHLAIGLVEGLVTAAIVALIGHARPDLLDQGAATAGSAGRSPRRLIGVVFVAALANGGVLSWFASKDPDGLEWSMERVAGERLSEAPASGR